MAQDASPPTSLSLLERVRTNDQDAWGQLVHLYGPLVHRWCQRAALTEDDIADVFQDSFRSVFLGISDFSPRGPAGSFRSWLRSIVRSRVIDWLRRRGRQPIARGGSDALSAISNLADPLGEETDDETANDNAFVVQRACELIRPEFSEQNWLAFQRVVLNGESAADVARRLGLDPQAVRQANYRIRRRLRVVLRDLTDDPAD